MDSIPKPDLERKESGYEGITTKNEILAHLIDKLPKKILKKSKDRVIFFLKALNRDKIDMTALKVIAFRGIPDEVRSLRGVVWRLLLGYLPNKPSQWIDTIYENK
jgi:hypothetical protein